MESKNTKQNKDTLYTPLITLLIAFHTKLHEDCQYKRDLTDKHRMALPDRKRMLLLPAAFAFL